MNIHAFTYFQRFWLSSWHIQSPNNIQQLNFIKLFKSTVTNPFPRCFSELSLLTVKLPMQTVSLRELLVLCCRKLGRGRANLNMRNLRSLVQVQSFVRGSSLGLLMLTSRRSYLNINSRLPPSCCF